MLDGGDKCETALILELEAFGEVSLVVLSSRALNRHISDLHTVPLTLSMFSTITQQRNILWGKIIDIQTELSYIFRVRKAVPYNKKGCRDSTVGWRYFHRKNIFRINR